MTSEIGTLPDRFWAKVARRGPEECWLWMAYLNNTGYGNIKHGGREGRMLLSHRVSYELHFGPIPVGMCVCHRCDNPACVNPSHLFLGTHAENMADRNTKGRAAGPLGESNRRSKLRESDIRDIRHMRASGFTQQALAERFDISQTNVSSIVRGKTWGHVK